MAECKHLNLYPSMDLQLKMGRCGHFLLHGDWECLDCHQWIFLQCEDEWEGREGTKTKDGKYEYRRIDGKNKVVNVEAQNLRSKPMAETAKELRAKVHTKAAVNGGIRFRDLRKAFEDACDRLEQLEIRLKESRKIGSGHKDRELANAKKCNEYYEQIKQLQAKIERQQESRKEMVYVLKRLKNCWEHDIDGSWIRDKEHKSHLFSLVFNDMRHIILRDSDYRTMLLPNEEQELAKAEEITKPEVILSETSVIDKMQANAPVEETNGE